MCLSRQAIKSVASWQIPGINVFHSLFDYSCYESPLLFFAPSNLIGEVCVLEDMTSHLPVIEVRIEECRGTAFFYMFPCLFSQIFPAILNTSIDFVWFCSCKSCYSDDNVIGSTDEGIDVRIRGLKIKSSCERDLGLNADVFLSSNLVRYPRLQGNTPDVLYRRALIIQR